MLRFVGNNEALALLRSYLTDFEPYWTDGLGWRQAQKLDERIANASEEASISRADVVDRIVTAASERSESRPAPVYVVNVGGSGSHWLANMLNELPGLREAAEVYVPDLLMDQMSHLPADMQAVVVDGIHLVHAWGRAGDWQKTKASSVVNTAHRPELIGLFREWDVDCKVIHLYRDPRDRALSLTYRKEAYRSVSAPDMDDETYLRKKAKRSDLYLRRYRNARHHADVEVSYESLRADAVGALSDLVRALDLRANDADIRQAVFLHDADNIRAGLVESKGNLDEGGKARGWRHASVRDRLILHHLVAHPVIDLGYQLDDCLARDRVESGLRFPRRNRWAGGDVFVDQLVEHRWFPVSKRWARPGSLLRVRPGDRMSEQDLVEMFNGTRPDVVCFAGRRETGDDVGRVIEGKRGVLWLDGSGMQLNEGPIPATQSLPDLRWVSAIDTPIEEWANGFSGRA